MKCRFCLKDVKGPSCLNLNIAKNCEDYKNTQKLVCKKKKAKKQ